MNSDIVIAAPILARNAAEADILAHSAARLAEHGPVILTDGGSIDSFVERVSAIKGVTVLPTPGTGPRLVAQVCQALTRAAEYGATRIFYTEPDKRWFFENRLAEFLTQSNTNAFDAGVCLPARDARSFATFPAGQQMPERLFNTLAGETLGLQTDFLYGPLLLSAGIVSFLTDVPNDLGWGWRTFLLTVAARRGLPIIACEADLPCPQEQRGEDDERSRTYRIEQMAQNVRGLALGRKFSLRGDD